ncbi:MAG: ArsB/NhaD family transporter [Bacilli bacterium]|nr:hypothetical protein [Mollicutes bacterium]MDY3899829.1 ArsB/NhaD family transporter [Bacilli bacterium]
MIPTIIISSITMIILITTIIIKPSITIKLKHKELTFQTFWMVCLVGAIVLLITGLVSKNSLKELTNFSEPMNPFKILILFISISILSIILEEAGFFELCAVHTLKKVKNSQKKLFCLLYLVVTILTMFTSNDIIILTFTPFICYFTKRKKINPIPYLVGEFVGANTLSLMFIIGNPTNIYLATYYEIGFFEYFKVMAVPTVVLSLTAFLLVYLIFRRELSKQIVNDEDVTTDVKCNKHLIIVGLIHLITCTILLILSSYLNFEMWYICLGFAVSITIYLFAYDLINHEKHEIKVYKKAPWSLVPFVLSMFIIVLALKEHSVLMHIADWFDSLSSSSIIKTYIYGISSYFSCSLINNIPMSVAYASILENSSSGLPALYATIIGSNLGALLTPVGALAGIMWLSLLKSHNIKFNFITFMKYGIIISIPTILVGISVLLVFI